jgi:hypothetical protein
MAQRVRTTQLPARSIVVIAQEVKHIPRKTLTVLFLTSSARTKTGWTTMRRRVDSGVRLADHRDAARECAVLHSPLTLGRVDRS